MEFNRRPDALMGGGDELVVEERVPSVTALEDAVSV